MYRQWPRSYNGVEFLPVELPGRETRLAEPNVSTYQELAAAMARGLSPFLDIPYGFFGHCGSALAAYEVTVELLRGGFPAPAHLFVSSEVAPQDGPYGRLVGMNDRELATELEGLIRSLGGEPTAELISLYLGVLSADVAMNKRYVVPDPVRLSCPITAIGWTEDVEIPPTLMGGWPECGETTFVELEGGHERFLEAPQELLTLLSEGLPSAL